MRKLVVTQKITLDGSIEMLTTWFDPTEDAPDLIEESHRQDAAAEALLVGRQTFEDFRGYWPHQHDDPTGISDYLNAVHKYVVSSTMTDPAWQNSTVLAAEDVARQVNDLKHRDGKDIVVTGSISLTHELISARLVDEFRLFVYPTVQGRGRRLFPQGAEPPQWSRSAGSWRVLWPSRDLSGVVSRLHTIGVVGRFLEAAAGHARDMAISKDDKVEWNTSQGTTEGHAREKRVSEFTFEGQKFNASKEEPYWIVESSKTGAKAAHKESSLTKKQ